MNIEKTFYKIKEDLIKDKICLFTFFNLRSGRISKDAHKDRIDNCRTNMNSLF